MAEYCDECKYILLPADWFMLVDDVWASIATKPAELLHLGCAVDRLGRPLVLSDFSDAPTNLPFRVLLDDPALRGLLFADKIKAAFATRTLAAQLARVGGTRDES